MILPPEKKDTAVRAPKQLTETSQKTIHPEVVHRVLRKTVAKSIRKKAFSLFETP